MLNSKQITSITKSVYKNLAITENAKLSNGRITTTNLDVFNTYHIGGFSGNGLISVENLKKVLKTMKKPTVEVTDVVKFSEGKKSFTENNDFDLMDFPESQLSSNVRFLCELNTNSLKSFSKFCGNDELIPKMQGVNINNDRMAATDAHILKWDKSITSDVNVIIPKTVIDLLTENRYFLYGKEGDIWFGLQSENGWHKIEFRAIEDLFPVIENVIPSHDTIAFKADKKEFIKLIKEVMPFADKSTNKIVFAGGKLIAEDIHNGSRMEVDFEKEGCDFAVNAKLLLTVVNQLSEDFVELKSGENNRPLILNDTSLLMPVLLA